MLVRLIYASRATEPITSELIDAILGKAREQNAANGITGVLGYGGEIFLQAIEGGRKQVNALYARLQQDPRHKDLTLLEYTEIEQRQYANWSMGKGKLDRVNLSLLLKYSATATLDPFCMPGKASGALLAELASAAFATRD